MIPGVPLISIPIPSQPIQRSQNRSCVDDKKLYFLCKRAVDIFISLFVILFFLTWLIPLISALVKVNSKGPAFFVQRRVGRGGKSFRCYKFRTMIVNPEADTMRAISNDPRVTRLGRILRLYNIDEFPQFVNVLLGHMSVVGPRPHMHSDCSAFSQIIPGYKFRNFVKPGITGLAQAKGYHGPTSNDEMIEKRFEWDAFYVRHASMELDFSILQISITRLLFP